MTSLSFSLTLMTVVHFFSMSRSHLAQVIVPFRVTSLPSSAFLSSAWAGARKHTRATADSVVHTAFIVEPPHVTGKNRETSNPLSDVRIMRLILEAKYMLASTRTQQRL